jgi:hypothetical protein
MSLYIYKTELEPYKWFSCQERKTHKEFFVKWVNPNKPLDGELFVLLNKDFSQIRYLDYFEFNDWWWNQSCLATHLNWNLIYETAEIATKISLIYYQIIHGWLNACFSISQIFSFMGFQIYAAPEDRVMCPHCHTQMKISPIFIYCSNCLHWIEFVDTNIIDNMWMLGTFAMDLKKDLIEDIKDKPLLENFIGYGFFSKNASKLYGHSIYASEFGNEVKVTAVVLNCWGYGYNCLDKVCVGKVIRHIRNV